MSDAAERTPDMHHVLLLHVEGVARLRELIAEAKRLQDAGRMVEARRAFREAEKIEKQLNKLEVALKLRWS